MSPPWHPEHVECSNWVLSCVPRRSGEESDVKLVRSAPVTGFLSGRGERACDFHIGGEFPEGA